MGEYSRGNKQKIAFLSAILTKPEVLIIDEPIVGLAPSSIKIFGRTLTEYAKLSNDVLKQGIVEELITTRHKLMIQSIGGETDKGKLATTIRSMPASDSRAFRKYVDKITPGVELTMPFVCGACGQETKEVEVPLGSEFFWPKS